MQIARIPSLTGRGPQMLAVSLECCRGYWTLLAIAGATGRCWTLRLPVRALEVRS